MLQPVHQAYHLSGLTVSIRVRKDMGNLAKQINDLKKKKKKLHKFFKKLTFKLEIHQVCSF